MVFQSRGNIAGVESLGLQQVYLYDYDTDRTVCLSCRSAGGAPGVARVGRFPFQPRVISSDGTHVVFSSTQRLLPEDVNAVDDAYEWVEAGSGNCQASSITFDPNSGGCLYLLSSGTSAFPSQHLGMSADGKNIYIQTYAAMALTDTDNGSRDIYDVRAGGGSMVSSSAACVADGCQGQATFTPGQALAGSAAFSGVANAKKPRRAHKSCRHTKRKSARRVKPRCAKPRSTKRAGHGKGGGK